MNGREWDFPVGDQTRLRGGKVTETAALFRERASSLFDSLIVLLRLVLRRLAYPRGVSTPSKGLLPLQVWGPNQLHSHHPWFPKRLWDWSQIPPTAAKFFLLSSPNPRSALTQPVDSEVAGDKSNPKSEATALPHLSPRGLPFLPLGTHSELPCEVPWLTNKQ